MSRKMLFDRLNSVYPIDLSSRMEVSDSTYADLDLDLDSFTSSLFQFLLVYSPNLTAVL